LPPTCGFPLNRIKPRKSDNLSFRTKRHQDAGQRIPGEVPRFEIELQISRSARRFWNIVRKASFVAHTGTVASIMYRFGPPKSAIRDGPTSRSLFTLDDPKERQSYLWPLSSLSASLVCRAARAGSPFRR
jgi:hypothetical protein